YEDPDMASSQLYLFIKKRPVYFLHGYPSAIYNFACYCRDKNKSLLSLLKRNLKGAFLTSEYPSPVYRNTIENVFNIPTQSFYGHTETCIIAYEYQPYEFQVLQTYGYAECGIHTHSNLIGTNFFNFESPLIRYDPGDRVSNVKYKDGILDTFKISDGRTGDYILDYMRNPIHLTGLIFRRHHKLFNFCKHIQIMQTEPGKATVLYVESQKNGVSAEKARELFDTSGVKIVFAFKAIDEPILTSSGKIKLLVKI